jgi:hypothetical protein
MGGHSYRSPPLPYILGEIVAGLIWRYIYDGNYGVVAAGKMDRSEIGPYRRPIRGRTHSMFVWRLALCDFLQKVFKPIDSH